MRMYSNADVVPLRGVQGACGQLPMVPKTSTCTYAIPASRPTMYTAGGYISLLLLINLLLIIPICYKVDQFGMIFVSELSILGATPRLPQLTVTLASSQENILVFAGLGTCLGIYNAGMFRLCFVRKFENVCLRIVSV